jgi:hypothetical protein
MKKLLMVLGLLVLVRGLASAQGTYYVDYYANNAGPTGAFDQIVRIINVGTLGSPLTSPTGDICANIYVFDPNQEMIACCAEPLTPNELDAAYVGNDLTFNTLTTSLLSQAQECLSSESSNAPLTAPDYLEADPALIPPSGVVKIVLTPPPTGGCNPTAPLTGADAGLGAVWGTHVNTAGGFVYLTETEKRARTLGTGEAAFLPHACSCTLYFGSGRGTCRGHVSTGLN